MDDNLTLRAFGEDDLGFLDRLCTDPAALAPSSGSASAMSARAAAAGSRSGSYARWLQDPAVVARVLHNGASDQEIYKLTQ